MEEMDSLVERCPRVAELDNESLERLNLMIGSVDESVGIDHLVNCLADNTSAGGDGVIRCYVGFEPSGKAHIGWKSQAAYKAYCLMIFSSTSSRTIGKVLF